MAKPVEQFQPRDITFWGLLALAVWAVAIVGANVSALIPPNLLAGLHSSRLDSATLAGLRNEVDDLEGRSAQLRQDNAVLLQRFAINEQANGEVTRRVGALELSMPKLVEAINTPSSSIDRTTVTGSTGNTGPVTTFAADGGSVSYTTSPLQGTAPPSQQGGEQPMPQTLGDLAQPDPSAFGVALGAPIDENEGEGAWQSVNTRVGTLLMGLAPLLGHVEGGSGRRLVAGPIATEAGANELCGRMAKVGIACATVPFIGDPLPLLN